MEGQDKHSKSGIERYIFNCKAYRLEGSNWIRLEKIFIESQFDNKGSKGIEKVKIKGERAVDNTHIVKITFNGKDYLYSMTQELQIHWLVHIIEEKVTKSFPGSVPGSEQLSNCAGIIYKKTGLLGAWEKCFVTITQDGLSSAKDETSPPNLQIAQAKEIWTRFELIEGNSYFVFKLRDFFKYEFGAPVESISRWTKAFYSLIRFD